MAMMAAMKNVLSPNSDTMMTEIEATKAWMNPRSPLRESSSATTGPNGWGLGAFCKEKHSQISYRQFIIKAKLARLSCKASLISGPHPLKNSIWSKVNKSGGDVSAWPVHLHFHSNICFASHIYKWKTNFTHFGSRYTRCNVSVSMCLLARGC